MDPITELLELHISIRKMPDNHLNRLKCILTGHEMARTEAAINQYINGKRYKRLSKPCVKASNGTSFFYEDYLTYIPVTPGANNNRRHCNLTSRIINNNPIDICRHISGARFGQALEKFKQCEKDGTEYIRPSGKQPKHRGMRCKTKLAKKAEKALEGEIDAMEEAGKSCNIAKANAGGAKPLDDSEDDSEIDEDMFDACVAGEAEETELLIAAEKKKAENNEESEDDDEEDEEDHEEVLDCVLSMDDLKTMAESENLETGKTDEIEDKMEEVDISTSSQDEIEAKVEAVETTVKTRTRKAPQAKAVNSKKRKTK
jgi:hypothetical protein